MLFGWLVVLVFVLLFRAFCCCLVFVVCCCLLLWYLYIGVLDLYCGFVILVYVLLIYCYVNLFVVVFVNLPGLLVCDFVVLNVWFVLVGY